MEQYLQAFTWLPLIGFLLAILMPRKKESLISGLAISVTSIHFLFCVTFIGYWLYRDPGALDRKHLVLFTSGNVEIFIDFYFDRFTAVFAGIGSLIAVFVAVFSRYYMHREEGFKRFFVALLLFFLGYNIVIFSGNFETLFVGWEVLGICSFLLIAFYRDRYLPVKNGLKVISFFRMADICLLLGMWMSHHLWHENVTFLTLNNPSAVASHLQEGYSLAIFITVMIVFAAVIKSAQFPFTSWLPRAMEGPTTSSAIFYGSLSVHLGVFILLRTYPFWESLPLIKVLVIVTGAVTALVASGIARVQSTVKTQISYSSVAQIGLMFIEVATGLHAVALIHFAGNAFLRTYQLLVSPSVMSYLTHDQFYHFAPRPPKEEGIFFTKLKSTFYVLSVKEWDLDFLLYRFLWSPFKLIGNRLSFLTSPGSILLLAAVFAGGAYIFYADETGWKHAWTPYVFSFLALAMILKAFTERANAVRAWLLVSGSQFFIALSIALNKVFDPIQIVLFLSGGTVATIIGYLCLSRIRSVDNDITLNKYHGYVYEYRRPALVFLLCCLGMVAFPISPAFLGFDLLLTNIDKDQYGLIALTALCFVFTELAVLRIYCRVFLGQHKKAYHPMAFRSS